MDGQPQVAEATEQAQAVQAVQAVQPAQPDGQPVQYAIPAGYQAVAVPAMDPAQYTAWLQALQAQQVVAQQMFAQQLAGVAGGAAGVAGGAGLLPVSEWCRHATHLLEKYQNPSVVQVCGCADGARCGPSNSRRRCTSVRRQSGLQWADRGLQ